MTARPSLNVGNRRFLGATVLALPLILVLGARWLSAPFEATQGAAEESAPRGQGDSRADALLGEVEAAGTNAGRVVAPSALHGLQPEVLPEAREETLEFSGIGEAESELISIQARVLHSGRELGDIELELRPVDLKSGRKVQRVTSTFLGASRFQWELEPIVNPDALYAFRVHPIGQKGFGWAPEDHALGTRDPLDLGTIEITELRERYPVPLITGLVCDELDRPIEDATGYASPYSEKEMTSGADPPRLHPREAWAVEVSSKADGSFAAYGNPNILGMHLTLEAPGFHAFSEEVETQKTGLVVRLGRKLIWRGRLVVPEDGPETSSYGVWLMKESSGTGVGVAPDGQFEAVGHSSSAELIVTYPLTGSVVLHREPTGTQGIVPTGESPDFWVHEVDLRGQVRVLDLQLLTATGEATSDRQVRVNFPEGTATLLGPHHAVVEQGRVRLVVPLETEWLELVPKNGDPVRVPLGGASTASIPWPR